MDTSLAEEKTQTMPALTPDSFFFISPYRNFTTSGCFARYTESAIDGGSSDNPFQQKMNALFADAKSQGITNPVMVGAIPFDTRQPSSLFILQSWQSSSRVAEQRSLRHFTAYQLLSVIERKSIPEQDSFEDMIVWVATLTSTPEVDKVVLSRLIGITADTNINSDTLLERLMTQNPANYNFHVPAEGGGILAGASPKLLLRKGDNRFSSPPLAGSTRHQPGDILDHKVGIRLLASREDRHEYELATQAMEMVLRDRNRELQLPSSSQLVTTSTLWHLDTPFEGKTNPQENALILACLLHSTPALSGFPHQVACELIAGLEPFDRELFGDIVGWCDAEGNGRQVVAIRCTRLLRNQVRFFAGVRIVSASSPVVE